jgi:hypothetical protein
MKFKGLSKFVFPEPLVPKSAIRSTLVKLNDTLSNARVPSE